MEESISLLDLIKQSFELKEVDIRAYSPLTLAYIGDCVYDLVIRTVVVERGNEPANKLHKKTVAHAVAARPSVMTRANSRANKVFLPLFMCFTSIIRRYFSGALRAK